MFILEKKEYQISPFLVFFLIHSVQLGVGVLGFQRIIIKSAGNDSWMAVIVGGITINVLIWIMYVLLNKHQTNLIQIHKNLFGKWIGNFLSCIWIIYWTMIAMTVFRTYIEIVQVWVFQMINIVMFGIILVILIFYGVSGGFRIVSGICFLGVVIPFYLFLTFFFPLEYADYRNLLPIWNHTVKDMAIASKDMTLSYLGFSTLLMYYPYIKNAKKSQKWAHLGNLFTMGIYLFLILVTIVYFSEGQVERQVWATLSLWKIVEMPFVERFEYIGITSWVLIILPNICLSIWAATKGVTEIIEISEKKVSFVIAIFLLVLSVIIRGREHINLLNDYMSLLGLILVFGYLPLITILSIIKSKLGRNKSETNEKSL